MPAEDVRDAICTLCEPEIAARIKPVWGLDDECEMNSAWRDCGVENLWIMLDTSNSVEGGRVLMDLLLGSIATVRSHSVPLALRESPGALSFQRSLISVLSPEIKATKEGIFKGERYSRN